MQKDRKIIIAYSLIVLFIVIVCVIYVYKDIGVNKKVNSQDRKSRFHLHFTQTKSLDNNVKVKLDLYSSNESDSLSFSINDILRAKVTFSGDNVDGELWFTWTAPKGGEKFNYQSKILTIKSPYFSGWSEHKLIEGRENPLFSSSGLLKATGNWILELHWKDKNSFNQKGTVIFRVKFQRI